MNVIDLNYNDIDKYCCEIKENIENSEFKPDVILGVLNGGRFLGERMHDILNDKPVLSFCKPEKNKSFFKKFLISNIIRFFPTTLKNQFRKFEALLFFNKKSRKKNIGIDLPPEISKFNNILIVDDAIDSGATIVNVKNHLLKINPEANIRVMVITITKKYPLCKPDYFIFNNQTLVRFPWSMDAI